MKAIREAAVARDLRDVVERVERCLLLGDPRLELAHPGRIDEEPGTGQLEKLALRRCVASTAVRGANGALELRGPAEDAIHEGRFADPGRPDDGRRHARR